MKTSIPNELLSRATERLQPGNLAFAALYPGDSGKRQPVHTVYGGAHLFKATTSKRSGEVALGSLREYAPDYETFARALGLPLQPASLPQNVYERVRGKLEREAIEDFRIDFEDGYGNRPDAEEDQHAIQAADEVGKGLRAGSLPPFLGIRIKPFTEELRARSMRSLDLFVTAMAASCGGKIPQPFIVTLPKVTIPEQVEALVTLLEALETQNKLPTGSLEIELMVETTQSIFDSRGQIGLPALVRAAKGRCTGAHFGTYDYTASCDITAAHQSMTHAACDFAKDVMKVSLAGTGVFLSDGATNIMPVGKHKAKEGQPLHDDQMRENRATVHRAWKIAYDANRHSLVNGFYQGWDLHPAQLPVRYAAVYTFFLEGFEAASARLKGFMEKAAQATLTSDVFDDAATGQGLLNYFLRAHNCGAVAMDEVERRTGLTEAEIRTRSFARILVGRRR